MTPAKVASISSEPRWQFRLGDLLLVSGLTWVGLAILTPLCMEYFDWHRRKLPHAVVLVIAVVFLGASLGFLRAQFSPHPARYLKRYMLLYMFLLGALTPWFGWLSGPGKLAAILLSLPALLWAVLRSAKAGFGATEFECRLAAGFSTVGLGLVVFAAFILPNCVRWRTASNESAAIVMCKTYAEAQDIYCRTDWDSDGVLEYAQRMTGEHSLFEKSAGKADLQLIDRAFARASQPANAQPKAGYFVRILTAQGAATPGGFQTYMSSATDLTRGYALIAWPARWDRTGRNTFVINNCGTVYQKDLGPETANLVAGMTEYDPGPGWVVAE